MSDLREASQISVGSCDFCSAVHVNFLDEDGEIFATASIPIDRVNEFCRRVRHEKKMNLARVNATEGAAMNDKTLAYLATPYTKLPSLDCAAEEAALIAARLLNAGVHVFCPVAHYHLIAEMSSVDPRKGAYWQPLCDVIAARCDTLIVAHMTGWQESKGIAHEVEFFTRACKPIFDLPDITTCTLVRRPDVLAGIHAPGIKQYRDLLTLDRG